MSSGGGLKGRGVAPAVLGLLPDCRIHEKTRRFRAGLSFFLLLMFCGFAQAATAGAKLSARPIGQYFS